MLATSHSFLPPVASIHCEVQSLGSESECRRISGTGLPLSDLDEKTIIVLQLHHSIICTNVLNKQNLWGGTSILVYPRSTPCLFGNLSLSIHRDWRPCLSRYNQQLACCSHTEESQSKNSNCTPRFYAGALAATSLPNYPGLELTNNMHWKHTAGLGLSTAW